uniref:Uncharacterized protein n=1 Tax=viral metagenome TaxID=1070528 RepID=A0A6M3IXI9_9ZZZZ
MPKKEECAICGKTIAKDPMPYYHAKIQDSQTEMWRHTNCPGNPHRIQV